MRKYELALLGVFISLYIQLEGLIQMWRRGGGGAQINSINFLGVSVCSAGTLDT